jgi:hypothetical protein
MTTTSEQRTRDGRERRDETLIKSPGLRHFCCCEPRTPDLLTQKARTASRDKFVLGYSNRHNSGEHRGHAYADSTISGKV